MLTEEQQYFLVTRGMIMFLAFGGLLLAVVIAEGRRRMVVAGVVGGAAAFVIASMRDVVDEGWSAVALILAGAGLGVVTALAIAGIVHLLKLWAPARRLLDGLAPQIDPGRWGQDAGAPRLRPAPIDVARRWFVAIAAATGGATGALITYPEFSQALAASISPTSLLSAGLIAVVSLVLIGPVQDFVFERSIARDDGKAAPPAEIVEIMTSDMSLRSALRLSLVGVATLALELLFNCLDQSIRATRVEAPLTILLVAVTPGAVSYYWCAALQARRKLGPLRAPSTVAATTFGAVQFYAFGWVLWILVPGFLRIQFGLPATWFFVLAAFAPVMAVAASWIFSALVFGLPAFAGGLAIDRLRGWRVLVGLFAAQWIVAALPQTLGFFGVWWLYGFIDWSQYTYMTAFVLGWIVGLAASDFPGLVRDCVDCPPEGEAAEPAAS